MEHAALSLKGQLARLEEMSREATGGPWTVEPWGYNPDKHRDLCVYGRWENPSGALDDPKVLQCDDGLSKGPENAYFVAACVNFVRSLLVANKPSATRTLTLLPDTDGNIGIEEKVTLRHNGAASHISMEFAPDVTEAAGRIMDIWCGGTDWRNKEDPTEFDNFYASADWLMAVRLASAALDQGASPPRKGPNRIPPRPIPMGKWGE